MLVYFWQASAEARRNQLMRDMAQLRLRAEVTQLEGSLQQTASGSMESTSSETVDEEVNGPDGLAELPPYIVPDAPTLCDSLVQIKQLAASSRFIIIIPLTGTAQLLACVSVACLFTNLIIRGSFSNLSLKLTDYINFAKCWWGFSLYYDN